MTIHPTLNPQTSSSETGNPPLPSRCCFQHYPQINNNHGIIQATVRELKAVAEAELDAATRTTKIYIDGTEAVSGSGGNTNVSVASENGTLLSAPVLTDKTAWQHVQLTFDSDGDASTTVLLSAIHNTNGQEKIIGFGNVVLTLQRPNSIDTQTIMSSTDETEVYDLQGRRLDGSKLQGGVYIVGRHKVLVK